MAQTVFILGAGASKEAGVPLMAEFLDVAHRLWKTNQVTDQEEHFQRVFKGIGALQRVHSKSQLDFDNIESVFAAFEMAKTLATFPGVTDQQEIAKLSESLRIVIATTIEMTLSFPANDDGVHAPQPYGDFAELIKHLQTKAVPKHTVAVLTFNYDLAIDFAFHKAALAIDYGLNDQGNISPVPVLKLHGSLNWGYGESASGISPWRLDDYFRGRRRDAWTRLDDSARLHMVRCLGAPGFSGLPKISSAPVIVPPTWDKSEHHRSLAPVWRRAAEELRQAENIFVIGYSLPQTDAFFRYLYALGTVGEDPLKRFWVYNPDKSLKERYLEMLGPATASPRRFTFASECEAPVLVRHGEMGVRLRPMTFSEAVSQLSKSFGDKRLEAGVVIM